MRGKRAPAVRQMTLRRSESRINSRKSVQLKNTSGQRTILTRSLLKIRDGLSSPESDSSIGKSVQSDQADDLEISNCTNSSNKSVRNSMTLRLRKSIDRTPLNSSKLPSKPKPKRSRTASVFKPVESENYEKLSDNIVSLPARTEEFDYLVDCIGEAVESRQGTCVCKSFFTNLSRFMPHFILPYYSHSFRLLFTFMKFCSNAHFVL